MRSFRDKEKRDWEVVVDVGTITRVREVTGVDLSRFKETIEKVTEDIVLLVNVLYVICRDQCLARNMTDTDFGKALDGDSLNDGCKALMDAMVFFSPSKQREVLTTFMNKMDQAEKAMIQKAQTEVDKLDVMSLLSAMESQGS